MPPDWVNVPGLGTTTPDAIVSVPLGRAIVPVNVLPVSRSKLPELNSTTPLEPAKVPLWPAAPSPCVSCSVPALARTWLPGVVSSNTPMAVALVPVELAGEGAVDEEASAGAAAEVGVGLEVERPARGHLDRSAAADVDARADVRGGDRAGALDPQRAPSQADGRVTRTREGAAGRDPGHAGAAHTLALRAAGPGEAAGDGKLAIAR